MKILFATGHPYIPQIAGGAQSSTHELMLEFAGRGHRASVLTGLTGEGRFGFKSRVALKLQRSLCVVDDALGYDVYRAWHPVEAVTEVVERAQPDVAVMQSGHPVPLAQAFIDAGVPTVVYLRNAEVDDLSGDPSTLSPCRFVANSHFTARWYEERYGLASSVVYPLFDPARYRTDGPRDAVVFINPHPLKGLSLALDLADARPEIPFIFVEAWTMAPAERAALCAEIAARPNVTLMGRTTDMRTVYARARVLLAPSQWQEAFGRVAAEAHYSAIPVLSSRIGGLPEAVGDGGVLVDHDAPVAAWSQALGALWHDKAFYERTAKAAARHAERPELQRERQLDALTTIFEEARATSVSRPPAALALSPA